MIIRVSNPDKLDYEKEEGRDFVFKVNAMQGIRINYFSLIKFNL